VATDGGAARPQRLYVHMQKNFEDQVVKREEEEREAKLRELKQSRQPVSRSGIAAHQQKYQDILRQKKEQLKNQRDGLGYGSADNVNQNDYGGETEYPTEHAKKGFKAKILADVKRQDREARFKDEMQF
jgi:hypothetical protein